MTTKTKVKKNPPMEEIVPKFRDPSELTPEQLTDPDYSLKELMKQNGQPN